MTAGRSVSRTEILLRRFAGLAVLAGAVVMPMSLAGASGSTTPPGVILGEGGSFAQPIIDALLKGSTKDISPEAGSYFLSNVDLGRDDFATGNADFAVTEFPLTSQQAGFAKTNGRAYAYVPFAAQSVALGAIVEREVDNVLKPTTLNKDIQLNDVQIADIYTNAATAWNSTQLAPPSGTPYTVNNASRQVSPRYLVDPALTTYDLEALILDNPAAKAIWSAWLKLQNIPVTPPSELWPTNQGVSGGDDILASNLVPLDETKRPPVAVSNPTAWGQGDIAPLPASWLGAPWNIPACAVVNAGGSYVFPTVAATEAALSHATMDPKTNIVTFDPANTDKAAYPMVGMSYLVVPLTGEPQPKLKALAAFVRYVLSAPGQAMVQTFGAAPVTPAMAKAGLKVADELEAAATATTTTTSKATTTTAHHSTTTTSTSTTSTTTSIPGNGGNGGNGGNNGNGGGSLAFTGGSPLPLAALGGSLILAGGGTNLVLRRRRRRRGRASDG